MSEKMKKRKRGDRFPLLIYRPLGKRWSRLGILTAIISFTLWWFAPQVLSPDVGRTPLRHLALVPVMAGIFLTVYGFAARRLAYVRCFRTYLRIQTPFYPLVVSYRRIQDTRPVQLAKLFDPKREKAAFRNLPRSYWAMTAVAVELNSFPLSERWLRLWLDRYLFTPDMGGFVFLVKDWMGFSQQLDSFLSVYQSRRGR
ncbi:MAG: hypothetical protein PVH62_03985 [Anaerolineae bacterium]|jgi:hypothetical protein